jgi:hypothetical protein
MESTHASVLRVLFWIAIWGLLAPNTSTSVTLFGPLNAQEKPGPGGGGPGEKPGPGGGAPSAKEARWHGMITRINKDASTMDVRKANIERKIHWDSSTKWTMGTKAIDTTEFKEGAEVICLGTYEKGSGVMKATRIDLRKK